MIPAKDPALAQVFGTYRGADKTASRIQADDPEWQYGVERLAVDRFIIKVLDEEGVFLGYL